MKVFKKFVRKFANMVASNVQTGGEMELLALGSLLSKQQWQLPPPPVQNLMIMNLRFLVNGAMMD
jgi:hypothetical protein